MRQTHIMLILLLVVTLFQFGDAAVTVSSVVESGSNLVMQVEATESSGSVTSTISSYAVGGNAYELASSSEITASLTINDLSLTYEMVFKDPVDKIREDIYGFGSEPSYGAFQTISKTYAQKLIDELSATTNNYGAHKGNLWCAFGLASGGELYGILADGNTATFTTAQEQGTYAWDTTTIQSTYRYWQRIIKGGTNCGDLKGYLVWGADDANYDSRKRWAIQISPGNMFITQCPSTGYARATSADLTAVTTGTCAAPSAGPFCSCGNCNDGTGWCISFQYNTGWTEGSGKYAAYDDSDNQVHWASYTAPGSVDSTSGSHTTLGIQVGSGSTDTHNLHIDGSFSTSGVSYDGTILSYFASTTGYRLIIPDIGIYQDVHSTNPPSTEFVVIPDNKFDTEHECNSVLVDAYEWFVGTQINFAIAAGADQSCSDNMQTKTFCTETHSVCMNNTLNNWLTWGQLDRADVAFPGIDLLDIGGYSSRVSVVGLNNPTVPDMYTEDNVKLTLQYGFNNALSYPLTLAKSAVTYKEPEIGTVNILSGTATTTSTHFNIDIQVTNSGDLSGDFYYYASCDGGTVDHPTFTSSTTTIAAGATATISTSVPGPACLADDHTNLDPYTFVISYTQLPLWSGKVESSQTLTPPPDTTAAPTKNPTTAAPTKNPTTDQPTTGPSTSPSTVPSTSPTVSSPTISPTTNPSKSPSVTPSTSPSQNPATPPPSTSPISNPPSVSPTPFPVTSDPTCNPTTTQPSNLPSKIPTTTNPSRWPSRTPTISQPTNLPTPNPVTSDPTCNPTVSDPSTTPTLSYPTIAPSFAPSNCPSTTPTLSVPPSPRPVQFDTTCTNVEMYTVQNAIGNILEHQATCIDRPVGSYVIDYDTSEFYIVGSYAAADEDDEETHTAIFNCNQDTGVQTTTAAATELVGHNIIFVSNWAETSAYFGSLYDPEDPISMTIRIRLGSFNLTDYPEGSEEYEALEEAILSDICSLNTGAFCSQFSIANFVEGSIIVVLNLDAIDEDGTKLIDIQRNLRNEIASFGSDPHQTPNPTSPLDNVDRFYWNNKKYEVIFTHCPLNQYIELDAGETEVTISWTVPTAEFTAGNSVTPERVEGADIVNGASKPVGSYYFRYVASENGAFALPCTFFIKITSPETPESTIAQMVEWMTNEVMLVVAVVCAIFGICMFLACWRKFGIKYEKETEGEFTGAVPKTKGKKGKRTVVRDLESSDESSS